MNVDTKLVWLKRVLLFKILVKGYVPGKFRSMTGPYQHWMVWRRYFLPPYAATWGLALALFFAM